MTSRDRLVAILRPVAEAIRPPADVRRAQRVERAITDDGRPRLDRATGALPAHALIATAAESVRADPTDTSTGATVQDQLQDQAEDLVDIAVDVAGKVERVGDTMTGPLNVTTATETVGVAGVTAGVSGVSNLGAADPAAQIGSIYPTLARLGFVVARKYTSAGGAGSPSVALTAHLEAGHATGDGVAILMHANATVNNAVVFGGNAIARNNSNTLTGTKLVGFEIDVEPASGGTVDSGSGGLYINVFNVATVGPAIQLGGIGGGTWTDGIILNGIGLNNAGLTVQAGASEMEWGVYLANGTYGTTSLLTGAVNDVPSALIRQSSVGSPTANILAVQNSGGTVNFLTVDVSGALISRSAASADNNNAIDSTSTGRNVGLILRSAGSDKWTLLKDSSDAWHLYSGQGAGTIIKAADGATPALGFLGAAVAARQSVGAAATDAATTQTLVNALRAALVTFGLCQT